jgi:hypothetical protein
MNGAAVPREALRAEHDVLAEKLAVRRSVDAVRRAAYSGFGAVIASGLATRLAWDRWFSTRVTRFRGPPIYLSLALAASLVLGAVAALLWLRARRLMRAENADFARFRALRELLDLDP